ncbi:hypothetical protein LIER_17745 [Lithospermum erythrorhizon]|uniref:Uncharacterized protein n=1 Tax=Lithospermum erythrorhizon TaxID=34254 RepID=A0AAV3QH12_LITER
MTLVKMAQEQRTHWRWNNIISAINHLLQVSNSLSRTALPTFESLMTRLIGFEPRFALKLQVYHTSVADSQSRLKFYAGGRIEGHPPMGVIYFVIVFIFVLLSLDYVLILLCFWLMLTGE